MADELNPSGIDPALVELVTSRRSIYDFGPGIPEEDLIRSVFEAAVWAPNHKHTNPWKLYTLGDKARESIMSCYRQLVITKRGPETAAIKVGRWENIPAWFVVTSPRSDNSVREREDYGACCCMVQNMALMFWSAGIGLKWSTGPVTDHPTFFSTTGIDPTEEIVVGLFGYGFPEEIPSATRLPVDRYIQHID